MGLAVCVAAVHKLASICVLRCLLSSAVRVLAPAFTRGLAILPHRASLLPKTLSGGNTARGRHVLALWAFFFALWCIDTRISACARHGEGVQVSTCSCALTSVCCDL